jgi:adenylate cyclase
MGEVAAGLALGALLARAGDYFGPAVNLAARLVEHAEAGMVIVDERLKVALGGDFTIEPIDRQSFTGIGEAAAWTVRMRS